MLKWLSKWFISSRTDWGAFASEERSKRLTIAGGKRVKSQKDNWGQIRINSRCMPAAPGSNAARHRCND
jgi:hypothetical protein